MTKRESEVLFNPLVIFIRRAEFADTGAPVILGEEEEEDEDEEWTSPQDGYVSGPRPSLILTPHFRELGVLEAQDSAPGQFPSIFGIGNPFADIDGSGRSGSHLIWTSGRRGTLQLAHNPKLADECIPQLLMKQLTFSVGPQVPVLPQKQQRIPYFSILPGSNGLQTNNHE